MQHLSLSVRSARLREQQREEAGEREALPGSEQPSPFVQVACVPCVWTHRDRSLEKD